MDTVLIPPIPDLDRWGTGRMNLLLSHLLSNSRYTAHYAARGNRGGAYNILDNSAHEFKSGECVQKLVGQAELVGAQEIVIPDVLFDADATMKSLDDSMLQLLTTSFETWRQMSPQFMIVPQARSIDEWKYCTTSMVTSMAGYSIRHPELFPGHRFTFGLSKDYEAFDGGLFGLLESLIIPLKMQFDPTIKVDIHLLGWGRDLYQLNRIARTFGDLIRSVDSAKPFVYARYGMILDPLDISQEYPGRPQDYFDVSVGDTLWSRHVVDSNIRTFGLAAKGCLPIESVTLPVKTFGT